MTKQYKKPPIIEALCEFQFIPTQPWDLTVPGLVYEKIRENVLCLTSKSLVWAKRSQQPNTKSHILGYGLWGSYLSPITYHLSPITYHLTSRLVYKK